jgi:ferritin heavy chain
MSSTSQVRVVFTEQSQDGLNRQINNELYGFYVYQAMASWCARDDVALLGLREYCLNSASEELSDARGLIDYMSKKGGLVKYFAISAPFATGLPTYNTPLELMNHMLELEKKNYQSLLVLHQCATSSQDFEMEDFLESNYLKPQVKSIKNIADLLTNLKRVGVEGAGVFLWDREIARCNSGISCAGFTRC